MFKAAAPWLNLSEKRGHCGAALAFYIHGLYCLRLQLIKSAAVSAGGSCVSGDKKKENLVNLNGLTGIIVSKE